MASKNNNTCAGCLVIISGKELLKCRTCNSTYDLECANVSEKRFYSFYSTVSKERRTWTCPACQIKLPKHDNSGTPVRRDGPQDELQECSREHVTLRNKPKTSSNLGDSTEDEGNLQRLIQKIIRAELAPIKE
ncbi:unnamed protein product [Diatraea saccharalis]|uniref:Zinc finger PHD-type domain-containing protein n=1 Tax=Diatraea saccharalis TaxID=40085 RepID=A0A9N9R652_9NEOP|nr:unnamed protein product [Diatraea saccharalis]